MLHPIDRLKRSVDFESVRAEGRVLSDRLLVMRSSRCFEDRSRFGLTVSRRVGNAVVRNKVKRRLWEAIRSFQFQDGWNVTVSARRCSAMADYWALRASIYSLAVRSGLLYEANQQ